MRWWFDPPVLRTVIVTLKDDPNTAIRGVLWNRGPWFTIRNPETLRSNLQPNAPPTVTPLEGEVVIHRSNVAFLQVMP